MEHNKKHKIIKILILIITILIFIGLIIYLFPLMKELSTQEGQLAFKERIVNLGVKGFLILFMLQLAQIVLVVLPGEPLEILAGMCYGSIGGMIFIFVSVFITTTIIYLLVKKYGKKYLYESFSKEKIDKIENTKAFKNPKKIELILAILFLIPGTPKDLLTYIGGLLPISYKKFVLIATFARFPSVISSTIAGENIVNGKFTDALVVYGVTFALTALSIVLINIFDKDKGTKEALRSLK